MVDSSGLKNESGQAIVEYAILIGVVAVALIPVLTAFTIAVNHYFESRTEDIQQSQVKISQAQDKFIQYMDARIAYLTCLADLNPNQPSSACGASP
jgi:Flp pilus assembly pilin Flp